MDNIYIIIKCYIVGLTVAGLIGPIALLCINKALKEGTLSGISIGLGAATADGLYGFIASFFLNTVKNFIKTNSIFLSTLGGLILVYLGVKSIISSNKPPVVKNLNSKSHSTLFKNSISTFILTITNPATILIFMSIFASLNFTKQPPDFMLILMILSFFSGSLTFYSATSITVNHIKHKLNSKTIKIITTISGIIILGFGIFSISQNLHYLI